MSVCLSNVWLDGRAEARWVLSLTHKHKWGGEFSLTHTQTHSRHTVTHSPTFIYMCKWVYSLVYIYIQNWFSHQLVLMRISPPVLDLPYLHLHCCVFFIKSSLVEIKSCKSCRLIPSFINLYPPVSLTFWLYSNWGWNRHRRVKLGLKDRVTWRIYFIFWRMCKLKEGPEILKYYCQGPSRPQWKKMTFQNRGGGKET